MHHVIAEFIQHKNLAVIGAARDGKAFGNIAVRELRKRGYQVFPVHPQMNELDGQPVYPDLAAVRGKTSDLLVSVPASAAEGVLHQAASLGYRNVWLQQGAEAPQLLALANELGLNLVSGKCILMYAEPVRSVHNWHRIVVKLMGKL